MTKEEIREELEYIDDSIVSAIIECCKELFCDGVPLYDWDRDTALQRFDKALADWEE
jgi:hypothetical protein